jgi:hypothetical protein
LRRSFIRKQQNAEEKNGERSAQEQRRR